MTVVGEATVVVRPDSRGFPERFRKDVEPGMEQAGKGIGQKLGAAIGGAFVLAGVKQTLQQAITAASDVSESTSKVQVVFGDAADEVERFASNSAEAFGQSKAQALEAAGTFGNLFRSIGLTEEQSAQFATSLTGLASDLASFNNTEVDEALVALRSGLVGETEPLKRFGVNLNEATLKAKALELGLGEIGPTLTASQKAQAAYALILEQTGLAQGDFERTADGAANKTRILQAQLEESKAALGQSVLPAYSTAVGVLSEVAAGFNALPEPIRNVIVLAGGAAVAFAAATPIIRGFGDVFGGLNIGQKATEFTDYFRVLRAEGESFGGAIKGAGRESGGLAGILSGGLNPAVLGVTAAIGAGLGIYSAWSKNVERVKQETEALTAAIVEQGQNPQMALSSQLKQILDTRDSFLESFQAGGLNRLDVARAVGADPKAFDEFRSFFQQQLGESLESSNSEIIAASDGVKGLAEDFDAYRSQVPDSLEPTIEQLIRLYNEGALTENQFREIIDAGADLSIQAQGVSAGLKSQADELANFVNVGAQSKDVQEQFRIAAGGAGISLDEQRLALEALANQFPYLSEQIGIYAPKGEEAKQSFEEQGTAADDARVKVEGYADALTAAFDPVFAAANASEKLADSQAAVAAASSELGLLQALPKGFVSEQGKTREELIAEAQQKLTDAQRDNVAAAVDQEAALARLREAFLNGEVSTQAYAGSLLRWEAQGIITKGAAQQLNAELLVLNTQASQLDGKNIGMTVELKNGQATVDQLREIDARVRELALASGIDPESSDGGAQRALGRIRNRVRADVMGRASGGPVHSGVPFMYQLAERGAEIGIFGTPGQIYAAEDRLTRALVGVGGRAPEAGGMSVTFAPGAIVTPDPRLTALETVKEMRAEAFRRGGSLPAGARGG